MTRAAAGERERPYKHGVPVRVRRVAENRKTHFRTLPDRSVAGQTHPYRTLSPWRVIAVMGVGCCRQQGRLDATSETSLRDWIISGVGQHYLSAHPGTSSR